MKWKSLSSGWQKKFVQVPKVIRAEDTLVIIPNYKVGRSEQKEIKRSMYKRRKTEKKMGTYHSLL